MDRDNDGHLKQADFVTLFQEGSAGTFAVSPVRQGSPKVLEGHKTNHLNSDLNRYANRRKEFPIKLSWHKPRMNEFSA